MFPGGTEVLELCTRVQIYCSLSRRLKDTFCPHICKPFHKKDMKMHEWRKASHTKGSNHRFSRHPRKEVQRRWNTSRFFYTLLSDNLNEKNFTTHLASPSPRPRQCCNNMFTRADEFHTLIFTHTTERWTVKERKRWMDGYCLEEKKQNKTGN